MRQRLVECAELVLLATLAVPYALVCWLAIRRMSRSFTPTVPR